jgi:transposase
MGKKPGLTQINYSLLANELRRPISVKAFPGEASDLSVFPPTIEKIRKKFGLLRVVMGF